MALSNKPWGQFSEADYTPEQFCAAALVDDTPSGAPKTKASCHLPVREPDGALNRNALFAAQGALVGARGGVKLSPAAKRAAARRLMALMHANDLTPADSLRRMAGG